MTRDLESPREMEERLRSMSEDDGDTWDLSDNDKAACRAGAEAMRRLRGQHDASCESELTSHGYTPCQCADRLAALAAPVAVESYRCSGCGHIWDGHKGAELCGDCWRKAQTVVHGVAAEPGNVLPDGQYANLALTALRACDEALQHHDQWCGRRAGSPGHGSFNRAERLLSRAIPALEKFPRPVAADSPSLESPDLAVQGGAVAAEPPSLVAQAERTAHDAMLHAVVLSARYEALVALLQEWQAAHAEWLRVQGEPLLVQDGWARYQEKKAALRAWTPAQAEPAAPVYPIPLNEAQKQAAKTWASDDRLWTTQETVEFNLRTFARAILAASTPAAPEKS